jgi:deoxycytidylate deaminase
MWNAQYSRSPDKYGEKVASMKYLTGVKEVEARTWMMKASEVAARALCKKAKCGTVIVQNNEIIGTGYNAPVLDKEENRMCDAEYKSGKPKYDTTCCVHAEWRAIVDALKQNPEKISGSTLYFSRVGNSGEIKKSGKPFCTVCSRLAVDNGIKTFVLWHEEGILEYPTAIYNRMSYEYIHQSTL